MASTAFTFDVITAYVVKKEDGVIAGYFVDFADACEIARPGDHIHMVCGRGNSVDHAKTIHCPHTGCMGTIAPFPGAVCNVCRSN